MDIIERFLNYVSFETTSDENSETSPSSSKELPLLLKLKDELIELGLHDVEVDKYGYCYGFLDASEGCEKLETIGLLAHVDTSNAVSGKDIKPRKVKFDGNDIKLNDNISIVVSEFPEMKDLVGETLIVTDGTTLLGADDKAGVAEIMGLLQYLKENKDVKHGKLAIAFTPDEEIGRGVDNFDVNKFNADYAYTVDGGLLGELEYECFNAASAKIKINGISIHPGSAKNKMKNAILVANDLISMLPPAETPSHTENYEGFYHITDISGQEQELNMGIIIRDHDDKKFSDRKEYITKVVDFLNHKYGAGTIELDLTDSYYNMRKMIEPHMEIVDKAKKAMLDAGVTPKVQPIRGGTDGSRLSYMGLLCPNLSTGGGNFHGVLEYVSIEAMHKMVEVLINIVKA